MKIVQIDIGKCEVFKKTSCLIRITLGSCVGLVIFDEISKIVGAIHILLPSYSKFSNKTYSYCAFADKGIPYVLEKIRKYSNESSLKLKAIIAGGANLGGDYFSIGLKNYKETIKILKLNNIEIVYEDCLGQEPRILEFNCKSFSYNISSVEKLYMPGDVKLKEENFYEEIESCFSYLPVLNSKILQLFSLRDDENISFSKLEEIIKTDDSLTLNLLKYVNSSYFSPRDKITDIKYALSYIGLKNFFNFLANEILKKFVVKDLEGYMIEAKFYKMHVISVAFLSEYIADFVGIDTSRAYLAGLFHDIGKIIVDFYALRKFNAPNRLEVINFVEKSITTFTHAYIGARFLKKSIKLDNEICEAVELHHYPDLCNEKNKRFVYTIALANSLVSNFLFGTNYSLTNLPFKSEDEIYKVLNLTLEDVSKIVEQTGIFISISEELVDDIS